METVELYRENKHSADLIWLQNKHHLKQTRCCILSEDDVDEVTFLSKRKKTAFTSYYRKQISQMQTRAGLFSLALSAIKLQKHARFFKKTCLIKWTFLQRVRQLSPAVEKS